MNVDSITELLKIALTEGFMITAPIAIGALAIGLVVGLLQTVTSIQEQTLAFVPKLAGACILIYVMGPWMLQRMGNMTTLFIQRAGDILR